MFLAAHWYVSEGTTYQANDGAAVAEPNPEVDLLQLLHGCIVSKHANVTAWTSRFWSPCLSTGEHVLLATKFIGTWKFSSRY